MRKQAARFSDAAVEKRTGKNWQQWFTILDKAGAGKMNHTEIAAYLYKQCGCPGWWNQKVAVAYEQARGLRAKYERPSGYQISRSKTIAVAVTRLSRAWKDKGWRRRWLAHDCTMRKATTNKSLRIAWADGRTSVDVNFYPRGKTRCQVTVQHSKLANAKAAEHMKAYWAKALARLAAAVEA